MRIKHTSNECYLVCSYLPCKGTLLKDIKRWYPYRYYATKQSALSAIKRIKDSNKDDKFGKELIWKIVWFPHILAREEECITVYTEEVNND